MCTSSSFLFFQRNQRGITMCEVCDFYEKLKPARKADAALAANGQRTIHGYYHEGDAAILASYYPLVGKDTIAEIAGHINHPRLLEVAGLLEITQRYLEGSFSKLRGVAINVVSNPLSILFWSPRDNTVHRVKTHESELLHGAMEKMALRRGSLDRINELLGRKHRLAVTYGCSCCAIAVATEDLPTLYHSDYYREREGLGRFFDSDVLTTSNTLFSGISVADVPEKVLNASADFGKAEVRSYLRFAAATEAVVRENPFTPDFSSLLPHARTFLTGQPMKALAAE
jgi:hypothetical protein